MLTIGTHDRLPYVPWSVHLWWGIKYIIFLLCCIPRKQRRKRSTLAQLCFDLHGRFLPAAPTGHMDKFGIVFAETVTIGCLWRRNQSSTMEALGYTSIRKPGLAVQATGGLHNDIPDIERALHLLLSFFL